MPVEADDEKKNLEETDHSLNHCCCLKCYMNFPKDSGGQMVPISIYHYCDFPGSCGVAGILSHYH